MGAIIFARLHGVVFGTRIEDMKNHKEKTGSNHSWRTIDIHAKEIAKKNNHNLFIYEDFMREECKKLFFLLQ